MCSGENMPNTTCSANPDSTRLAEDRHCNDMWQGTESIKDEMEQMLQMQKQISPDQEEPD